MAWLLYALMFGPTARVAIEDAYSGAVRVVDNVPLGPAAVGSLMSNVGYGVSRLFEQAFATPAMTDTGFADPLQTLMSVRKGTLSRIALGSANSPTPGADIERSFINYVADCTLYDVDIGNRSIDDILRDPSWDTALRSDLNVPTTELVLGGDPQLLPCDAAWTALSDYTTVEFIPALLSNLQAQMRLAAPGDVTNKVQFALDAIAGAGVDAQNYMVMTAMVGFLEKGIVQTHENIGQWELAATTEQAAQQRNAQWAAEQTLFTRIVRPMMTFFEGLIFAITPLMAFTIALGPAGIAMTGKYLLFGLWIQLWMPIMAIINLYLHMAIARDLDALQNTANLDVPSILSLYKLDFLLQDYLATGGMLAASTPAISLMLIYGSAITATHLAGRLQGGDYIDEKISSPDVMRPAPALAMSPIMEHAPLRGTTTTGADNVLWRADVGQSVQRDLSSKERVAQEASRQFTSGLASVAASSASRVRRDLRRAGHGLELRELREPDRPGAAAGGREPDPPLRRERAQLPAVRRGAVRRYRRLEQVRPGRADRGDQGRAARRRDAHRHLRHQRAAPGPDRRRHRPARLQRPRLLRPPGRGGQGGHAVRHAATSSPSGSRRRSARPCRSRRPTPSRPPAASSVPSPWPSASAPWAATARWRSAMRSPTIRR